MKTIEYNGKEYQTPDWANYVAADADGQVWCYEYKPEWSDIKQGYMAEGSARNLTKEAARPEVKRI